MPLRSCGKAQAAGKETPQRRASTEATPAREGFGCRPARPARCPSRRHNDARRTRARGGSTSGGCATGARRRERRAGRQTEGDGEPETGLSVGPDARKCVAETRDLGLCTTSGGRRQTLAAGRAQAQRVVGAERPHVLALRFRFRALAGNAWRGGARTCEGACAAAQRTQEALAVREGKNRMRLSFWVWVLAAAGLSARRSQGSPADKGAMVVDGGAALVCELSKLLKQVRDETHTRGPTPAAPEDLDEPEAGNETVRTLLRLAWQLGTEDARSRDDVRTRELGKDGAGTTQGNGARGAQQEQKGQEALSAGITEERDVILALVALSLKTKERQQLVEAAALGLDAIAQGMHEQIDNGIAQFTVARTDSSGDRRCLIKNLGQSAGTTIAAEATLHGCLPYAKPSTTRSSSNKDLHTALGKAVTGRTLIDRLKTATQTMKTWTTASQAFFDGGSGSIGACAYTTKGAAGTIAGIKTGVNTPFAKFFAITVSTNPAMEWTGGDLEQDPAQTKFATLLRAHDAFETAKKDLAETCTRHWGQESRRR
ncbi:hypothetical protein ERJ75_000294500 [Trypanosoma vivax]|nr:hypothetical protein ERJ75_000294500 [Trypanosoma vivax]